MKKNEKPPIAFFGLGTMGIGMAEWLLRSGFPMAVYNRSAEKARALAEAGAKVASSPREAANGAEIVVCMVSDDTASRAIWLGEQGALTGVKKGAVLVESSTLSLGWVRELNAAAKERGCQLLDAPVTGSKPQAMNGELTFLVGGLASALKKARPALTAMGQSVVHVGPSGSGALLKLVNNFMCGVQMVALAEAMALMEKDGLNLAQALPILQNGAPGSPLVKTMSGRMTLRDYSPNFLMRLMAKDLGYAIAEAGQHGMPLRTAAAALSAFEEGIKAGQGEMDFSAVVEKYRKG